ncbi:hypothetical protein [Egicoccus sp. AB-alg6-2]|uniref:hypothetical protein n=1 Tax=Egicoccus sp. AB-alg6-2 TaxID=3242692 RepID=UPI00359DA49C
MFTTIPPLPWTDATPALLDLAREDLADGLLPRPRLIAHAGNEAVGIAQLRPHVDDVLPPLLELLALFLPLGADRLTLALPGRAWSLEDPIAPVTDEVDLRQRVLLVIGADAGDAGDAGEAGEAGDAGDAGDAACRLSSHLYPLEQGVGGDGWRLGSPWSPPEDPEGPTGSALRVLLEQRHQLAGDATPHQLASQFARVLLLGHLVAVTHDGAGVLLRDTTAVPCVADTAEGDR